MKTPRFSVRSHSVKVTGILATVGLLLAGALPVRAQTATLFLDDGFEDDTPGENPNAPAIGNWVVSGGATVVTNDVTSGPSSSTYGPYNGNNFFRIQRTDGGQSSARIDATFATVTTSNTLTVTLAYLYESTGEGQSSIELWSGASTRRVVILASPDLSGAPYFTPTTFFTLDGNYAGEVDSSLPVTPGTWQTIKIEYTSGSADLKLTVNGSSETLIGAVTPGTVDRIRFQTGNNNSTYYLDDEIRVEATTNLFLPAGYPILFQDDFQSDAATTTFGGGDFDPVIGVGDVAAGFTSWTIREQGASYLQVINDTVPHNDIAGTNNYISIYRDSSLSRNGGAYGTGWNPDLTLNKLVQLDYKVFQNDLTSPGLSAVLLSQGPPGGPASFTTANASVWPTESLIDSAWHSIRILANFDSSVTQLGIAPQTYTLSIDGGLPTTNAFYTTQNSVQTLGFYGAANYTTVYFDDVVLQVIPVETLTVSIAPDLTLTFTGSPTNTYVVEASTNLMDWTSISTNTADDAGQFIYNDPAAASYMQRYYRGRSQ